MRAPGRHDARRRYPAIGYRHGDSPYPIELVGDATLRDGTVLHIRSGRTPSRARVRARPVRRDRYFRFFGRLHDLTPASSRFTQVDYDREMASSPDDGFRGLCRRRAVHDESRRRSAEFAVVVADRLETVASGASLCGA
jgi:hypothetical protein